MSSAVAIPVAIKPIRKIVGQNYTGATTQANGVLTSSTNLQLTTLIADAVIDEKHTDEVEITDNPVEYGSVTSDNAFNLPAELDLTYGWATASAQNVSNDPSFLNALYQQFLTLQKGRIVCQVFTGKRNYVNMLIKRLSATTDKENENVLIISVNMREILLATVQLVPISPTVQQAFPNLTAGTVNQGTVSLQSAPNFNGTGVLQ